ncbi:hypothetical protein NCLIV_030520 [Neospora caninum Liverpool]|uniref:OTU family cysteine protease n=1 Tax=Neospora caninum (strain Liverpool) TaxID=572307 RepID=F0VHQ4_NEOCL|nr:hypothetical protein NCLIV_030520 [Neospora caninum Liverpool]CBZ53265.1 hypothetical protein NCLIV_030520 [Neospora caninum Liverpool]CEL67251.1 TPA: OTU family cysteine protease [Neospora caninum Liverpool]|eukprot:XP_003883297.1 hypothetical protein NCLIV_030520 [Neospora caninum Liverpool]
MGSKKKNTRGRQAVRGKSAKERRQESDREDCQGDRREKKGKGTRSAPLASSFASHLEAYGLELELIAPDGNCLFRAFADQHCGEQERHREYREKAVDYIEAHAEDFKCFLAEEEESFKKYVSRMRRLGTWGSQMELQALSQVYQVSLFIHVANAPGEDAPWHGMAGGHRGRKQQGKKKGRAVEKGGKKRNLRRDRGREEDDAEDVEREESCEAETTHEPGEEQDWSICKMENFSEAQPCVQLAFHVHHEHYNSIRVRGRAPGAMLSLAQVRRVLKLSVDGDEEASECAEATTDGEAAAAEEEAGEGVKREFLEQPRKEACAGEGESHEACDETQAEEAAERQETRAKEDTGEEGDRENRRAPDAETETQGAKTGENGAGVCTLGQPAAEASGSCVRADGRLSPADGGTPSDGGVEEHEECRGRAEDAPSDSEKEQSREEDTLEEENAAKEKDGTASEEDTRDDTRNETTAPLLENEETAEKAPEGGEQETGASEESGARKRGKEKTMRGKDRPDSTAPRSGSSTKEGEASSASDERGRRDTEPQHVPCSLSSSSSSSLPAAASSSSSGSPSSSSVCSPFSAPSAASCASSASSPPSSSSAPSSASPAWSAPSCSSSAASLKVPAVGGCVSAASRCAKVRRSRSTGSLRRRRWEREEALLCSSRLCFLRPSSEAPRVSDSALPEKETAGEHAEASRETHPASGFPSCGASRRGSRRAQRIGGDTSSSSLSRAPLLPGDSGKMHASSANPANAEGVCAVFFPRRVLRRNSLRGCCGASCSPSRSLFGPSSWVRETCETRAQLTASPGNQSASPDAADSPPLRSSLLCACASASCAHGSPPSTFPGLSATRCSSEALPNGDEETGEEKDERETRASPLVCV